MINYRTIKYFPDDFYTAIPNIQILEQPLKETLHNKKPSQDTFRIQTSSRNKFQTEYYPRVEEIFQRVEAKYAMKEDFPKSTQNLTQNLVR